MARASTYLWGGASLRSSSAGCRGSDVARSRGGPVPARRRSRVAPARAFRPGRARRAVCSDAGHGRSRETCRPGHRHLGSGPPWRASGSGEAGRRSEEHTSELQPRVDLVCRLLLEKKKKKKKKPNKKKKKKKKKTKTYKRTKQ